MICPFNYDTKADAHWMGKALEQAEVAYGQDEVPVGCVIVCQGKILASGYNQTRKLNDCSRHAELVALQAACESLGNYRLLNTTVYVTLEPCLMCMGALVHARVARLVIGALDPKTGASVSCENHHEKSYLNHKITIEYGVLSEECGTLLKKFFKAKR